MSNKDNYFQILLELGELKKNLELYKERQVSYYDIANFFIKTKALIFSYKDLKQRHLNNVNYYAQALESNEYKQSIINLYKNIQDFVKQNLQENITLDYSKTPLPNSAIPSFNKKKGRLFVDEPSELYFPSVVVSTLNTIDFLKKEERTGYAKMKAYSSIFDLYSDYNIDLGEFFTNTQFQLPTGFFDYVLAKEEQLAIGSDFTFDFCYKATILDNVIFDLESYIYELINEIYYNRTSVSEKLGARNGVLNVTNFGKKHELQDLYVKLGDYIRDNPYITNQEIAKKIHKSTETLNKQYRELCTLLGVTDGDKGLNRIKTIILKNKPRIL